jgi:hypothetical protein
MSGGPLMLGHPVKTGVKERIGVSRYERLTGPLVKATYGA